MKNRICFVVQRYGLEVNGGAELQCRRMAERMCQWYGQVHVLTSKAVDYITWKDEYTCDLEEINGVHVHRFSVGHVRNLVEFNEINGRFLAGRLSETEEGDWIEKQGPYLPDLIHYLKENKDNFDVFIFCTYLYYPTVMGIQSVREKAILIPEAHNEPYLKMKIFQNVFHAPRFFFFNTSEEREMVYARFHNESIPGILGGAGVDIPEEVSAERFRSRYHIDNFILYVGRIDEAKNCKVLFQYFQEYKKRNPNGIKLVLMGKPVIAIPKDQDIISLGFVDEQDKFDGIAAADILVCPSKYESLSIVALEAMSLSTPVLVNGLCDVLRGHCLKSNGALYYCNYFEFEGEINYLLNNPQSAELICANAKKYVEENYSWEKIEKSLCNLIERIYTAH